MRVWKFLLIVLVILISSGCAASKTLVKDSSNKVMDVYLEAISNARTDSANYIKENLKINQAFGYVKPYVPVVKPADVKLVWIPAHKSESSSEVLVSGHWVYLMVKPATWFIETLNDDKSKLPLVVPYREQDKK